MYGYEYGLGYGGEPDTEGGEGEGEGGSPPGFRCKMKVWFLRFAGSLFP
jgi:hypothetical protein